MAFVFKFQFSPQYLFCQTRILDQLKLLQLRHVYFLIELVQLEHLDSRMFRVKIFDRGSSTFELVHMVLTNRMVLLGTHGLHCIFSLVMEIFFLRQFYEVIQLFLDNCIADCLVW